MREQTAINQGWLYSPEFDTRYTDTGFTPDPATWQPVRLPHTNLELPYNGFDEKSYQFVSSYWRQLEIPADSARLFLDFEGVMCAADVWLDGKLLASHKGGYTPFTVELTGHAQAGTTAGLLVRVDSTERKDIPPFGHVVDYLCYGGIYREVSLRSQASSFICDVHARPQAVMEHAKKLRLDISLDLAAAARGSDFVVEASLEETAGGQALAVQTGSFRGGNEASGHTISLQFENLTGIKLWDIDQPTLYRVRVQLKQVGHMVDEYCQRTGFRQADFRPDGFYLNGRRLPIIGLNRHQAWPHAGYAMPRRAQRRDAEILKHELHVNLVRTSHYPQSRHFLDACDELGLLVFEETPGWQHIGDREWQDNACADVEAMIRRDRSRPSVVLWGVRINESPDNHDFFARTNAIARQLDLDRQTGGVRCIQNSELLEDVYTFNDFTHSGGRAVLKTVRQVTGLKQAVPYMVSEHNGHMYPTKRFDNEERLTEHAMRHARVLDKALGMPGCAGAIGWCAFDYNTHKDFGSGDRICYHGVSDMFRHPKYAAHLYASQVDPASKVVLEVGSLFAKGERCAARLLPIEIYTNCDSVVLYRAGQRIGEYAPERSAFPNLPHPPIVIRDLIGDQLQGSQFSPGEQGFLRRIVGIIFTSGMENLGTFDRLRLGMLLARHKLSRAAAEALIGKYAIGWGSQDESFELAGLLGGKEVCRRTYGGDARAARLEVSSDDSQLDSGDWDSTRISIRALDQYGNLHPFTAEAVRIEIQGPARHFGPSLLPLTGGIASFWLQTTGQSGDIRVIAHSERFGRQEIQITVR